MKSAPQRMSDAHRDRARSYSNSWRTGWQRDCDYEPTGDEPQWDEPQWDVTQIAQALHFALDDGDALRAVISEVKQKLGGVNADDEDLIGLVETHVLGVQDLQALVRNQTSTLALVEDALGGDFDGGLVRTAKTRMQVIAELRERGVLPKHAEVIVRQAIGAALVKVPWLNISQMADLIGAITKAVVDALTEVQA